MNEIIIHARNELNNENAPKLIWRRVQQHLNWKNYPSSLWQGSKPRAPRLRLSQMSGSVRCCKKCSVSLQTALSHFSFSFSASRCLFQSSVLESSKLVDHFLRIPRLL
ncbi:hypothetical protein CDAR_539261 [Caerostris darwini]|uniref:Uncharacterized protein n=1 Tax=Caerostris darwini TaxID=1538125 RepID=A0AAV4T1K2_9ARAC|nr:hypothetical protein CDAR_539261 [Caerostris darwini]